jgi:hypothetical protein
MTKHTPGPWTLDGHNLSSVIRCTVPRGHPDAKHTCGDYETIAECGGDNWKANARLIAAAPDMLEALRTIVEYGPQSGMKADAPMLIAARAAIAKAEGRS